ncbi:MAG: sigma-54-dependent Fis family transcriptional regulator [Haliscomenobacter sp.]|nr:sigma-54-dependent Fis family transcriptional regulator [Haliscomenobacter sp.]MBK7476297.1 sigma-54-dependent Fis family transcriptional regulator [Haliscomenobacter sp.]
MEEIQSIKQRFGIVGQSVQLDRALRTALRVASTDLSVLIMGESGVGKEIFSKIIHSSSPRKHAKSIAINCGAIPEGTINSELFGHEKGAFTGAAGERKGYFETYNGGTIFLDEIGEMPTDTQAYLLRVLETGEFIRVGSSQVLKTNVRIIAATNVDLEELIKKNKFREDLYYRLNTISIKVPALRERKEDIYMLFRKFSIDFAERYHFAPIQLDPEARIILEAYHWPGNVRELKNIAEKVSILSEDRKLTAEKLAEFLPNFRERTMSLLPQPHLEPAGLQEREILYKLLFDMKGDLNDLKKLVLGLIRSNDLRMPDSRSLKTLEPALPVVEGLLPSIPETSNRLSESGEEEDSAGELLHHQHIQLKPVILPVQHDQSGLVKMSKAEVVDDNLRLEDHEKQLIQRALRKFNGRRKEAAQELGISERTLYRKIRQYNL